MTQTPPTARRHRIAYLFAAVIVVALLVTLTLVVTPSLTRPPATTSQSSSTTSTTSSLFSNSTTQLQTYPGYPGTPVFDATNGDLYISNEEVLYLQDNSSTNGDSVAVISAATNSEVATVLVGSLPQTPIVDTTNGDVYVPNAGSGTISVISPATNTVTDTITVGGSPDYGVYDSINGDVYVPDDSNILVVSTASLKVVATVTSGEGLGGGLVLDPVSGNVYVDEEAASRTSSLCVISVATSAIACSITAYGGLGTLVFDPANDDIYVYSDYAALPVRGPTSGVLVISTISNQLLANLTLNAGQTIVFDSANGNLYVSGFTGLESGYLAAVSSSNLVVANLTGDVTGDYIGPLGLAFDSFNGYVYATAETQTTNSTSSEQVVDVVSGVSNNILQSLPIGCTPNQPGVDPINGAVYLSCQAGSYVKVISGSPDSVSATIPIVFVQSAP